MDHPQLVEFAKSQLAKGVSRSEIEEHLRRQNWEDDVIASVLGAADPDAPASGNPPATTAPRRRSRAGRILVGLLLLGVLLGGYQLYRHLSLSHLVREQTKFVEFRGFITGQLEVPPGQSAASAVRLLEFEGLLDSTQLETPRASMAATFDPDAGVGADLRLIPPGSDAPLLVLTLMSVAGGAQAIGGVDVRFADWNTYLRPHRTPFSGNRTATAVVGLVSALLGPNILSDFWLQIPAESPLATQPQGMFSTEQRAKWALLFRPTDKIFGESRELRFLGQTPGGEIDGQSMTIHRYTLDGPWLTTQLVGALRQAEFEDKLELLSFIQALVLGAGAQTATASLDSLEISDGEFDVWVGKKDTLPHRMTITLSVKEGHSAPLGLALAGEMDITYGRPVTIEVPAQSINLKQLQEQLELLQSFGNLF